jgi:site-specific DNA recombinase
MEHTKHPVRRCAVYTRKSSEEGLEQDFNSLHAQREACEAFIRSQAGFSVVLPSTLEDLIRQMLVVRFFHTRARPK